MKTKNLFPQQQKNPQPQEPQSQKEFRENYERWN
jgi:hypothetical protein